MGGPKTIMIEAEIPVPFYEGLKLVHDNFGTTWNELFTQAVRGELQCMSGDCLESETLPLREKIAAKIDELLKEVDG